MTMIKGIGRARRNAKAPHYESHELHEYDSVREARMALQNSGLRHAPVDDIDQLEMAEWMWRNEASPEDAAIAFDLKLPGE